MNHQEDTLKYNFFVYLPFFFFFFFKSGFTSCKAEQPLQGMELKEKETQKDLSKHEICLERTYS